MTIISTRLAILLCLLAFFNNTRAQATLPLPDHIVVLIEENQPNSFIVGSGAAPYINGLIADSNAATFTQMFALEHPSQPDYFDLFAGNNQGVTDDNLPAAYPYTTPNMARELIDKGYSFVTYSQNLPAVGSDVVSSNGYARKHNPVANWIGTGTNQVAASCNQTLSTFPTDFSQLPTVSYVVPVEDSDMHNGLPPACVASADYWMEKHLDAYIQWARSHNSLLIYTFDEDDGLFNNNIPTVFFGPMVEHGEYTDNLSLYNILRTIEDIYGTNHAGEAASNLPITNCWKTISGINNIDNKASLRISPNPVSSMLKITGSNFNGSNAQISLTDITGQQVAEYSLTDSKSIEINTSDYPAGMYFYRFTQDNRMVTSGKFIVAH
ncbi:MAG: acid phosphatase [Bacteroidota bacterium]|nr:acid phosphatase [Bacteroidota bacterium]